MIFQVFVQAVADTFGTTLSDAGIMMSLFFTMMIILLIEVAAKGRSRPIITMVTGLLSITMFTFMQWLPTWTGGVLALALGILIAWYISKMGGI